jgi:hypothetical protein
VIIPTILCLRGMVGVLIDSCRRKICPFSHTRYHPGSVTSPLEMSRYCARVASLPRKNNCFPGKDTAQRVRSQRALVSGSLPIQELWATSTLHRGLESQSYCDDCVGETLIHTVALARWTALSHSQGNRLNGFLGGRRIELTRRENR